VRRLLLLVGAVVFVDTMFFAALTPLLPHYVHELGLSKADAGVLAAMYPAGALVAGIPSGIATAQEVALADKELDRTDGIERRDPRRRVVELWRGSPTLGRLDAARLAKFLADLGKAGRLVVVVTPPG